MQNFWLLKTEPGCFSIEDLRNCPKQTTMWDGVRNYQARNFMRDQMQVGDKVLFYHSVTDVGVAGLAEISSKAYPDPTQWNPEDPHFDPASPADNPRWFVVDVRFVSKFRQVLPLSFLRTQPELAGMELLRKGSRLSVQPVKNEEYNFIVKLAENF